MMNNFRGILIVKRRTQLDIIQDLLLYAKEDIGIGRTRLLYKTNLSSNLFDSYLNPLIEKEFLEERKEKGHKIYLTTEKGGLLLDDINIVIKKLRE